MSRNGSGTYSLPLPAVVTNTTISSTWANTTLDDLATALTGSIAADGQTAITGNLPMSGFRHTGVGVAVARTDYAATSQVQDGTFQLVASVAGTNSITGSLSPAITAYASGQKFVLIPANTNTAATTLQLNGIASPKNVFWNGAACVGDELRQNIPAFLLYDGTQFHIIGNGFNAPFSDAHAVVEGSADATKKVRVEVDGLTTATTRVITAPDRNTGFPTLGTAVATTSGSSIDFTGIPSWVTRITMSFSGVSANGTAAWVIQIGDSGGLEISGYLGACSTLTAAAASTAQFTTGFGISVGNAANVVNGAVTVFLLDAATNTWACSGNLGLSSAAVTFVVAGSKPLSATLDRISLVTTDAFDAGLLNIQYQ